MAHVNLTVEMPDEIAHSQTGRKAWLAAMDRTITQRGQITSWAVEGIDGDEVDEEPAKYDWVGWESEPEMTGDGSGDPEKHFLTIRDPHGEEYALIVHRTVGGKYPLEGGLATAKIANADTIVAALNAYVPKESYAVEMGVDIAHVRVHTLTISPFDTREAAEQFARLSQGVEATDVKEQAERLGLGVNDGELSDAQMVGRTIAGAALVDYSESSDFPTDIDIY